MSDHYPGMIRIGGPIPKAILDRLIDAVAAQGASLGDYGEPDATRETLQEAFQEGAIVELYDDQARFGLFEELEAFLVQSRVHFDRHSDSFYEFDAENVYYRGGEEPVSLPADQNGNVLLRWEEVVAILDDPALADRAKLDAIRRLVARPETEPLSPIRFI